MRKRTGFIVTIIGLIFASVFILISHNFEKEKSVIIDSNKNDIADITPIENKKYTTLLPVTELRDYKNDKFEKYSYQEKIQREKDLNKLAVERHKIIPISGARLCSELEKRGVILQPDVEQRMKTEQMTKADWEQFTSYVDQISSDEQKLKSELSAYSNFKDLKNGYDVATKKSGIYYGNDLLDNQNAYRQATIDDLKNVLNTGAVLPEKIMSYLVGGNNIDLAVKLSNAGYNLNTAYVDDFRSMSALEVYAESIAINPYESSAEEQVDSLNKLVQLGVPVKVNDGTRDALDILLNGALTAEDGQSQKLLTVAQKLNNQGLVLEESHRELLDKLRLKSPALYEEFADKFK